MSAREHFKAILDRLPDTLSGEEILRALAFDQSIQRGLADSESGRLISQEDMEKEFLGE